MKTLRCVYFVLCTAVAGQALGQKTYEEKLSEANELIADGVKSNNKEDLAEGYFRKGKLADGLGNYKEATVWFQKARLLYLEKKPSFELFRVLTRLSTVEYQQKHFKEALRLNEEAIKIAEEIDDDKARFMGYSARGRGLAQISLNQDDPLLSYRKVLNDFLLAEKYAKKIRDKAGLHEMYLIYGAVFQSYKKPQKSLELYLKILPDFKKKSFDQPKIIFFLNLAAIYIDLGKLPETIKILKIIEPIVQNPSYKDFNPKLRFNEVAASYQEASKNYKLANIHYRIMKDMLEKAVAQDNDGQITKLNRQYDLSARDAEIAQKQVALQAGKKLRNAQYWLLIVSAISLIIMASMMYYLYRLYIKYRHVSARNAMLVHEQNHRVKNNLQVISSMLNIQANMSDDRMITETIHEIKLRIDSMIQLQKQLYAQNLTGFVNLKILINELVQSAMYNFDIFGLNYEAEFIKDEFDMDLSMPLALVINELITNACKYAFKDQALPMLRISVATAGNKIEIEVKDNGLHPIENLKVLSENSSFGFKMINMLLKQIDGNLNYQYESGSKFKIAIKTNGKIKILLIEDEMITATDLKEILAKRGHTVIGIAKTYYETVSMVERQKPDLAVVDIKLRNSTHNGIEIAETYLKNQEIPYIFLTSQSDSQTFEQAKHTAPKAYLTKPFREKEVVFQIELAFEQHLSQMSKTNNPIISDTIYIFVENAHFKIKKKDIIAIEANTSYVKIFMKNQEKPLLITMNLKKMGGYLQSPNFFRLSRKYLVNLNYLQKFDNEKIWMKGLESTIPIPQNGKKELMNHLAMVKII